MDSGQHCQAAIDFYTHFVRGESGGFLIASKFKKSLRVVQYLHTDA